MLLDRGPQSYKCNVLASDTQTNIPAINKNLKFSLIESKTLKVLIFSKPKTTTGRTSGARNRTQAENLSCKSSEREQMRYELNIFPHSKYSFYS